MDRFKYFLFIFLTGVLIILLYLSLSQRTQGPASMDDLIRCITPQECRGKNCEPQPEYCRQIGQKKIERKTERPAIEIAKPKEQVKPKPEQPRQEFSLSRMISDLVDKGERNSRESKNSVKPLEASEIKKAIKQNSTLNQQSTEQAHREHQQKQQIYAFKQLDFRYVELGFNYALGKAFLAIPLIAFGMSIASQGSRALIQTFALFSLATIIAAAFTGATVIKNYQYLGPYMFLLAGVSLLLYEEQKSFALPIIGTAIGVFFGFTAAADGPLSNKWPFIAGTLLAAGFILLIFSIAMNLFTKSWFATMMTIFGGGLVALSLVMFALELNGNV